MCYATEDPLIFSSGHDIFYWLWKWKKKARNYLRGTQITEILVIPYLFKILLCYPCWQHLNSHYTSVNALWLFYKWSHVSESMLYIFLSRIWFYPAWNSAVSAKSLNDKWLAFGSGKCLYSFWHTLDYSPHKVGPKQKTNHNVTKGQIHQITSSDMEEGTRDI